MKSQETNLRSYPTSAFMGTFVNDFKRCSLEFFTFQESQRIPKRSLEGFLNSICWIELHVPKNDKAFKDKNINSIFARLLLSEVS